MQLAISCADSDEVFVIELRQTFRRLLSAPGFTVTAVAILGLGIGANTVVFSIIDAVYLDDPPHIVEPQRLVRVYGIDDRAGAPTSMPYPDFAHYEANQSSFDGLMGFGHSIALTVGRSDSREPARGMFVSHDYFDVLGVRPAVGRWFVPEEDAASAPQMAAVVSHRFWAAALGAGDNVVGQTLYLNGLAFVVVGVAPDGFAGPSPIEIPPDVWVPLHTVSALAPRDWEMLERPASGGWNWVQGIGRLREGVTLEAARADLAGLSAYLKETFPRQTNQTAAVSADARFVPSASNSLADGLTLMFVAAAAVLFAGTANVAILLSLRASDGARTVALSKALGATSARIARSALLESLIIVGLGTAVGMWLSYGAAGLAAGLLPASFSVSFEPDLTVLAFACLLALAVAVASALITALRSAQVDVHGMLKGEIGAGQRGSRLRTSLVVAQVAVAAVLVLAAALTARSVAAASAISFGFEPEGRVLLSTTLSNHGYTPEEGQMFVREALERLRALPGVSAVSTLSNVPFLGSYYSEGFRHPEGDAAASANMGINTVSPDFFAAMGIDLVAGRPIDRTDVPGGIPSIVVSATTARNLWPDQNPLGQRLFGRLGQPLWEVVGIVEDTRVRDLERTPELYGYTALAQDYRADVTFVVLGQASLPLLRESLYAVDASVAISDIRSMEEVIGAVASYYRSPALLMNVVAGVALVLAIVGLYGVLSFAVSRERREIGIRMALGASQQIVASEIVRRALRWVLLGLGLGGSAAWMAAPVLQDFLFGVEARDFVVWTSALLGLLIIAAAASALPARRAARLNPADALRRE